jgi:integrase
MSAILSEIEGRKIRFTPHSLRHSAINNMDDGSFYACEVRRIPRKQRVIQTFANHQNWSMTESYCKNKKYQSVTEELGIEIMN